MDMWALSKLRVEPGDQWLDEYFDATEAQLTRFTLRVSGGHSRVTLAGSRAIADAFFHLLQLMCFHVQQLLLLTYSSGHASGWRRRTGDSSWLLDPSAPRPGADLAFNVRACRTCHCHCCH